jgi:hypothetical protein
MTRLPLLSIPGNVRISEQPMPDVALMDIVASDVAVLIDYIESRRRKPRHSTTVRGMRLIRGRRA